MYFAMAGTCSVTVWAPAGYGKQKPVALMVGAWASVLVEVKSTSATPAILMVVVRPLPYLPAAPWARHASPSLACF
jgi:hypothetical protein